MTVVMPVVLASASAVVLAVATFAGAWILTAATALCVLALAAGWPQTIRLPHPSGSGLLVGALGLAGLVAGATSVDSDAGRQRPLAAFAALIAIAVLSAFTHELARGDGRDDLVESLTGTLTGQILAVLAVGWVLLAQTGPGSSAVVVAVAGTVGARLAAAFPGQLGAGLPMFVGSVAAVVASFAVSGVSAGQAFGVGLAVAGVGVAIDQVLAPLAIGRRDLSTLLARAAAPVTAAGTMAYAVMRISGA